MTIFVPQKLVNEIDNIVESEARTRSEVVREAVRVYLSKRADAWDTISPQKASELQRRIAETDGYIPYEQIQEELGLGRFSGSKKGSAKRRKA